MNEWDESGSETNMKCDACRPLLERYFDADLGEPTAELVADHLAGCEACARAYDELEREQDFYLRHEVEVEVSPTFWDAVSARTAPTESASAHGFALLRERFIQALGDFRALRFGPLLTTALIIIAIGGTVAIMSYRAARQQNGPQIALSSPQGEVAQTPTVASAKKEEGTTAPSKPAIAPRPASSLKIRPRERILNEAPRRQTPDELVREAEQRYLAAIAILARDANRRRSQFDQAERAQFDQALAAVDRTIAGTRRAVREHPTDPVAVQYMLAAYAKKVDVLRQMVSD